jgi:hypothetical protein
MQALDFEKLLPEEMVHHLDELSDDSLIVLSASFANRYDELSKAEIRFVVRCLLPKLGVKLADSFPLSPIFPS